MRERLWSKKGLQIEYIKMLLDSVHKHLWALIEYSMLLECGVASLVTEKKL